MSVMCDCVYTYVCCVGVYMYTCTCKPKHIYKMTHLTAIWVERIVPISFLINLANIVSPAGGVHGSLRYSYVFPPLTLQVWVCEFCGSKNQVDIVAEEIPTEKDTTYMIAPAPVVGGGEGGGASMEESLVIFCIDISGSMCVTTEVG